MSAQRARPGVSRDPKTRFLVVAGVGRPDRDFDRVRGRDRRWNEAVHPLTRRVAPPFPTVGRGPGIRAARIELTIDLAERVATPDREPARRPFADRAGGDDADRPGRQPRRVCLRTDGGLLMPHDAIGRVEEDTRALERLADPTKRAPVQTTSANWTPLTESCAGTSCHAPGAGTEVGEGVADGVAVAAGVAGGVAGGVALDIAVEVVSAVGVDVGAWAAAHPVNRRTATSAIGRPCR